MVFTEQPTLMLLPGLALVTHSLLVWVALVTVRPAAMIRARIPWQAARHTADLTDLPGNARDVADNYNHLMEQPTIFYALLFYTHWANNADEISLALAWCYVTLRVLHTIIQFTSNWVPARFWAFMWSTLVLIGLALRNIASLLA